MTNAELRRLAEAATPGPWYHRQPFLRSKVDVWDWYDWVSNMQINAPGFQHIVPRGVEPKNAAYIAAVNPQTVLGLLDEIERLRLREDLAAVREHEAPKPSPAPKRVAVQIDMDSEDCLFALANDGTIHCGWYAGGEFSWQRQIPPLPQPEDAP